MKTKIAYCFSANNSFLPYFYTASYSLIKNNSTVKHIFLLTDNISEENKNSIVTNFNRKFPHVEISIIIIDESIFKNFTGHLPRLGIQTYFRLIIPNVIPKSFTHALYLDSDIVINRPLNINLNEVQSNPLSAVFDAGNKNEAPKRGITNYYNAGILLMNLKIWREERLIDKALNFSPKFTTYADQDILNELFDNRWGAMDPLMNCSGNQLKISFRGYETPHNQKPIIVHFVGGLKPWDYLLKSSPLFWRHLLRTPHWYLIYKVPGTVLNSIKYKMKKSNSFK